MAVKTKTVALKNRFEHVDELRQIDLDPPVLKGDAQVGIKRLKKDRILVDNNLQRDGLLKK